MKKLVCSSVILLAMSFVSIMSPEIEAKRNWQLYDIKLNNIRVWVQELTETKWFLASEMSDQLSAQNGRRDRSYHFYADGLLLVFIMTKDYDTFSKCSGSHTFRFLPYRETVVPSFRQIDDDAVEGVSPSNYKVTFSGASGDVSGIEGFEVATSPLDRIEAMAKKKGGIEIRPKKGFLLIDYGWMTGESTHSKPWALPVLSDGFGNKCQVKNTELATRDPNDPDEMILKYKTNADMEKFLKKRCPALRWQ